MARTHGVGLLEQINDGRLRVANPEEVEKARATISFDIEELLETGARVRPLLSGGKQIGWVRGVHPSERKYLRRYLFDKVELVTQIAKLGTSLPIETIQQFSAIEIRALLRVISEMTASDLRLYPFLSAFVTTSTSEQLWFAHGSELTSSKPRRIKLPDGTTMKILSAPDQARLWAALCNYREKAKTRIDQTMNALMIVRPWAGKSADGLATELKANARALLPDAIEPWSDLIRVKQEIDVSDGWAHSNADDSREGILREVHGMMNNDKHERLMAFFEKQVRERAEAERQKIEDTITRHGGPGFMDEKTEIMTGEQVKERVRHLRARQAASRKKMAESESNPVDRLSRYE